MACYEKTQNVSPALLYAGTVMFAYQCGDGHKCRPSVYTTHQNLHLHQSQIYAFQQIARGYSPRTENAQRPHAPMQLLTIKLLSSYIASKKMQHIYQHLCVF